MRGRVLGYDTAAQATVVRGEDSRRYRFSAFEWREASPPRKGDEVDFEPDAGRARDVYRTKAAPLDATAARADSGTPQAPGETPAQMLLRQPMVRFLVGRPVLTTALMVLLACLVGAYAIDGARLSLFAAPDLAWRMSTAINGILAGSGPDPGPRLAGAAARISTVLMLLLYAVPALAAYVAWREFVGRPDLRIARFAGIAAMALPVALPGLVVLIVQAGVLPGLTEVPMRLGRDGLSAPAHAFHPVQLFAGGTVLVMVAGFALWAAASGRLSVWLATAVRPSLPPELAGPEVAEDRTLDFRPQRPRGPTDRPVAAGGTAAPAHPAPQEAAPPASDRTAEPLPQPSALWLADPRQAQVSVPPFEPSPAVAPPSPEPPERPEQEPRPPTGEGALRRASAAVAASSQEAMAALSERLRRAITGEEKRGGEESEGPEAQFDAAPRPRLRDVLRETRYSSLSPPPEPNPTEPGRAGPARATVDSGAVRDRA